MTQADMSGDDNARSLAEAIDWRARRTWLVFGGFAVVLGIASGAIIIGSELITEPITRGWQWNILAFALSAAAHFGGLALLSRAIPLRDGAGEAVQGYKILGQKHPDILPGVWLRSAWVLSIAMIATIAAFVVLQPFIVFAPMSGAQGIIPMIVAPMATQFPASVLVAKARALPDRDESV